MAQNVKKKDRGRINLYESLMGRKDPRVIEEKEADHKKHLHARSSNTMLKLIIKQKGLLLNLPEMPPVRTPAVIRISPKNLRGVMSYLNMHGVEDLKVVSFVDTHTGENK